MTTYSAYDLYCLLVAQERLKAERVNRQLRQQLGDYRVPDVRDWLFDFHIISHLHLNRQCSIA